MEARVSNLPNFLKHRSPEGLRKLMLTNNIKLGQQVNYISIQFVSGYWFAWFYQDIGFQEQYDKAMQNVKG